MFQVSFNKKNLIPIVIIVLVGLFYLSISSNSLIWDSNPLIKSNLFLKDKLPVYKIFSKGYWESSGRKINKDYYRPIVILSFIFEKKLWGISAYKLRVFNILFFILSLFLLFKFILNETKDYNFSLLFLSLFSFFPLNLDNVLWVAGRCDIFLLLFFILSIYFFSLTNETSKKSYYLLSNLFFLFGLFSKESFVVFFFVLIIYDYLKNKKINYLYHLLNFAFVIFFVFIRNSVIQKTGINFVSTENLILTSFSVLGYYFKSLIFPFKYSMFLPITDILNFRFYVFGVIFIILDLLIFIYFIKKKRFNFGFFIYILFNSFIGLYLLFAFSSVFPFSISTRYMMLPLIGFLCLISFFINKIKKPFNLIIVITLIFGFLSTNILNSRNYFNDLEFWRSNLKNSPENSFINYSFAYQLFLRNEFFKADKYLDKALKNRLDINTAFSIGILKSEIEIKRCNLKKALKWINSIKSLKVSNYQYELLMNTYKKIPDNLKIANYIYKNYKNTNDIKKDLSYLRALHCLSKNDEIKDFLKVFFNKYGKNVKTFNTLGLFYLKNVLNKKNAIFYFKKSLEINKNQKQIKVLLEKLNNE